MFEKYSEDAPISFFYARSTVEGGTAIEPENLLLGIMRAAPGLVRGIGGDADGVSEVVFQLKQLLTRGEVVQPRELLPFSPRLKLVLEQAVKEAQNSGADLIGPAHMLLACVVVDPTTRAANVLIDAGLTVSRMREYVESKSA